MLPIIAEHALHAAARCRGGIAVWGAVHAWSALAALVLGIVLAD